MSDSPISCRKASQAISNHPLQSFEPNLCTEEGYIHVDRNEIDWSAEKQAIYKKIIRQDSRNEKKSLWGFTLFPKGIGSFGLFGCAPPQEKREENEENKDKDRDGFIAKDFGGNDCDDTNAAVHPSAKEECNGIDDNCNEQIDEGCFIMERISVSPEGEGGNLNSMLPSISSDGRFVAFESWASNLVPDDIGGNKDIFIHDRNTKETKRVSLNPGGRGGTDDSEAPSISADGFFVAFQSKASNLVPGDLGWQDVFVHDRQTGKAEMIYASSDIDRRNNSQSPSISADGRFVAFAEEVFRTIPGEWRNVWDIFVRDRQTGRTDKVSVNSTGIDANNDSENPVISANGRFVAFASVASNLASGSMGDRWSYFVRDREMGKTEQISIGGVVYGNGGYWGSTKPALSADGRFVAFASALPNIVPGDTNEGMDVFVYDRQTRKMELVSVSARGREDQSGGGEPSISADGRFVAFASAAFNLVPWDTNTASDIFVHDRKTGKTVRVSVNVEGIEGNSDSDSPSISADGRFVAFVSSSSNLITAKPNGGEDIFVVGLEYFFGE